LDVLRGSKGRVLLCADHKYEEIKFFCQTCDIMLCSECIVSDSGKVRASGGECNPEKTTCGVKFGNHVGHMLVTVKQAARDLTEAVKDESEKARRLIVSIDSETDASLASQHGLKENLDGVAVEIESAFSELVDMLNQRKLQVLDEAAKMLQGEDQSIKKRQQQLRALRENLQSAISSATLVLSGQKPPSGPANANSTDSKSDPSKVTAPQCIVPRDSNSDPYSILMHGPEVLLHVASLTNTKVAKTGSTKNRFAMVHFSKDSMLGFRKSLNDFGELTFTTSPEISMQIFVKGMSKMQ
jgi:hypothetical protein